MAVSRTTREGMGRKKWRENWIEISEVNTRDMSRGQNELIGNFKMAENDVINIGGRLWSTHTFLKELKGNWWDLVWIATRWGKLLGLFEEEWWPFVLLDKLFLESHWAQLRRILYTIFQKLLCLKRKDNKDVNQCLYLLIKMGWKE